MRNHALALVLALTALVFAGLSAAPAHAAGAASWQGAESQQTATAAPSDGTRAPLFSATRQVPPDHPTADQPVAPMSAAPPTQFVPLEPGRIFDSRTEFGVPLENGETVTFYPLSALPMGVTAVAFNVTATGQTASGYLEVAPVGGATGTSTVNWSGPQETIANGHISRVSAEREFQITLVSSGTAHVILDLTGMFAPAGTLDATLYTPADRRLYDSRTGAGPLQPGEVRVINVNTGGVPPSIDPSSAAINVTATGTTGSGVFTAAAWPTDAISTINWSGGAQTVANAVITNVWPDGAFTVTNNGKTPAHLVVDLTGLFTSTAAGATGAQFYAMDPVRSYDSRDFDWPLAAGSNRLNAAPVPLGAVAIAVNTTITGTSGTGYVAVTPPTGGAPATSTVNWFTSPTTRANGSIVPVVNAITRAYAGGSYSTHYIYDVAGYFQ